MTDPTSMVWFSCVVEEGGFTAAARRLGVSKQAVSERIAKLEASLGVRLVERTTRQLRLTEAGAAYHARCAALAGLIDEANEEARGLQREPIGRLRISVPVLFGRRFLLPTVVRIMSLHRELTVEVLLADRQVDLVQEGFDLAIRVGELEDSSIVARKIGVGEVHYVASPSYIARCGAPSNARDLETARCIAVRDLVHWPAAGGRAKIRPVLVVNDIEVACQAAVAGVGIAQVPSFVHREPVACGELVPLFDGAPAMRRNLYAVYPSRAHLPAKVRYFVDAIAADAATLLPPTTGASPT